MEGIKTPTTNNQIIKMDTFTHNLLEEDKYELYDRNIRLWGKENQLKLSSSHVLLINLNCVITELAKNLLLSGINLYLYDRNKTGSNEVVSTSDVNCNYFLNSTHLGLERLTVLQNNLQDINQYVFVKQLQKLDSLEDVQCVCIGFSSFENLVIFYFKFKYLQSFSFRVIMRNCFIRGISRFTVSILVGCMPSSLIT